MKHNHFVCIPQLLVLLVAFGCSGSPQKFIPNGNHYFEQGKYAEAAIEYRNAIKVDPNSADAHYRLAVTKTKLGAWSDAFKELERTVDLQPDNTQAQLDLGNLALAGRDLERADQIAFALIQKDPNNAGAHSLFANVNEARDRHEDAATEIEKAIALQPKNAGFYLTRGTFQSNRGNLDAAERSFQKAIEIDPNDTAAITALARIYQQQRRWADAEKMLDKDVTLEPKSAAARLELARLYLAQQRKDAAEQVLIQAQKDLADDPNAYLLLPEFYESLGEHDKALAHLERLHTQHPHDLKAGTEYARLLLNLNQVDKANQVNEQVLAQRGAHTDALVVKGEILVLLGKADTAVSVLRTAIKDEPESALAHYVLGSALSENGDQGGAENEWRQAAQLQPSMVQVQRVLARLAVAKQDQDLLQKTSERIVENDPQAPDGYIFRAMAEANQKQPDKAEADLNRAIQLAPQNPLGFAKMGEWWLTQRRYADAEKFYEQALVRDPNFSDALRGLIATYTEEKQPARALARVQAQITKAPQNSDYYFILGGLQVNKKDFAAAESSLRKAISLDQNNMNAFFLLGQVEVQQGSLDKAIASSYEWIRQNPKDVQAYVLTGSLEDARGDWKKAQDLYKKALEIQPSYPLAENNLAYSMLENGGNADVALSLAQSAHSALPKLAALSDTLAWAYYHKGMYRTTISLLQEALKEEALKPEEKAAYHYHLGLAYEKSNDLPQAKVHLRRALELDDKSAQAELVRKALESIGG